LHHRAEPLHQAAVKQFDAAEQKFVHNYVLAEFVALATARGLPRQEVLGFVADIEDSFEITVVYVDEALHRAALVLLQRRLDKMWSLCDAVSFVLMERFDIAEALTTDHHFEQAGFRRLLVA
jgi:predicted nucleic acid-binding protein